MFLGWKRKRRRRVKFALFATVALCLVTFVSIRYKCKPHDETKMITLVNDDLTDGGLSHISDTSVCTFRRIAYVDDKPITLNRQPFVESTQNMKCILNGRVAVFGKSFAVFQSALIDPSKIINTMNIKGGEKLEAVWGQQEINEYFTLIPGYFSIACKSPPLLIFRKKGPLASWAKNLGCYKNISQINGLTSANRIKGLTLAIQRYEYVNLYHTMTDFYNAFVLKLLLNSRPDNFNILFVDAHPKGSLDVVWSTLFGNTYRAGLLGHATFFEKLVWGYIGYLSPLADHSRYEVPYLEEFRKFFLSRHEVDISHVIDCKHLNVVIVWRHAYKAHPRSSLGEMERMFSNEEEILKEVQDAFGPSAVVTGVLLETLTMKEQLSLISSCDVLIGMHGAGLSHTMFLPQTSGLVEMFPFCLSDQDHFKSIAKWRKITYRRWCNTDTEMHTDYSETYVKPEVIRYLVKSIRKRICRQTGSS